MKLVFKIILSVFLLFVLVAGGGIFYTTRGVEAAAVLEVNSINLTAINDGTYNGVHKDGRWTNEMSVTVKDHKITGIEVVKDVTFSKPEITKAIIDKVLEEQDTKVDAISGSTVTCKAYLKAIENALNK
jgi:uncharacterized protein with FMN-binding domain